MEHVFYLYSIVFILSRLPSLFKKKAKYGPEDISKEKILTTMKKEKPDMLLGLLNIVWILIGVTTIEWPWFLVIIGSLIMMAILAPLARKNFDRYRRINRITDAIDIFAVIVMFCFHYQPLLT